MKTSFLSLVLAVAAALLVSGCNGDHHHGDGHDHGHHSGEGHQH